MLTYKERVKELNDLRFKVAQYRDLLIALDADKYKDSVNTLNTGKDVMQNRTEHKKGIGDCQSRLDAIQHNLNIRFILARHSADSYFNHLDYQLKLIKELFQRINTQ